MQSVSRVVWPAHVQAAGPALPTSSTLPHGIHLTSGGTARGPRCPLRGCCAGVEEAQEEASPAGAEAKAAPPPPQSEEAAVQTIRAPRGGAGATQQRGDSGDLQQESDGEGDEGASSGQVNVYGF